MVTVTEMDTQQAVYNLIRMRGYTDYRLVGQTGTWSRPVMLGRQFVKLIEELAELGQHLDMFHAGVDFDVTDGLLGLGAAARNDFDKPLRWLRVEQNVDRLQPLDLAELKAELADIQVVLLVMAEVLQQYGEPFDLLQAALAKAQADVGRGVR